MTGAAGIVVLRVTAGEEGDGFGFSRGTYRETA
jgi:hypothetical protein